MRYFPVSRYFHIRKIFPDKFKISFRIYNSEKGFPSNKWHQNLRRVSATLNLIKLDKRQLFRNCARKIYTYMRYFHISRYFQNRKMFPD
jgi:hypothetical protein